jgi:hypothetical protein
MTKPLKFTIFYGSEVDRLKKLMDLKNELHADSSEAPWSLEDSVAIALARGLDVRIKELEEEKAGRRKPYEIV